ncbi:MAG: PD-(D/E)XK nuclease family protein [Elusimicrobiota bacterium]
MERLLRLLVAAQFLLSAAAPEAWANTIRAVAPAGTTPLPAVPGAYGALGTAAPQTDLSLNINPALGGVSIPNPLALPRLTPSIVTPSLSRTGTASPLQAVTSVTPLPVPTALKPVAAPAGTPGPQAKETVLESVRGFSRELSPKDDPKGDQASASRTYFDGGAKSRETAGGIAEGVPTSPADPRSGSMPTSGDRDDRTRRGTKLAPARTLPKAVFLLDVFDTPASDKTVEYIEGLLAKGVHVVFMTWRPHKGLGSAEEVLLSKIKPDKGNPIIVASHNGGRIAPHDGSADPAPIIADVGAFSPENIGAFRAINRKVNTRKELGGLEEIGLPSIQNAMTYMVRLSPDASPELRPTLIKAYNEMLRRAKLPFRMEAHPNDARLARMHSIPLRFSINRVFEALDTRFKREGLAEDMSKFLILADPKKSPRFSRSFPAAAEIQVARSAAEVEDVVGAVLGERRLKDVSVKLSKLRQFIEYWEPSSEEPDREDTFELYTSGVLYTLMSWFYGQVFQGQHKLATLGRLESMLRKMWNAPIEHGVYVSESLAKLMKTRAWKKASPEHLRRALGFVRDFYRREFGDYKAAADDVMRNLLSLSSDENSVVSLDLRSSSTGKAYNIRTRIPRLMKRDTRDGRVLTAYAYRPGKAAPDEGEEMFAKVLAMAVLVGHGWRGPYSGWRHGSLDGPRLTAIQVQLEYRSSHRTWVFSPDSLLTREPGQAASQSPVAREIGSAIERMEADPDFQKQYAEQEKAAAKKIVEKAGPVEVLRPQARPGAKQTAAEPSRDPLDLRFGSSAESDLRRSAITSAIRLVEGAGEEWYWNKLDPAVPVRVLAGEKMVFLTRISEVETKAIRELAREDFAERYSDDVVNARRRDGSFRLSMPALREKLVRELSSGRTGVNTASKVRVIRFAPPDGENVRPARPRGSMGIPEPLAALHRFLPKLVLLDLKLFDGGIPYELQRDMAKLMKAGVAFVLLSKGPQEGPGSVQEALDKGLSPQELKDAARYRLFSLAEDGNALYRLGAGPAKLLDVRRFSALDLDVFKQAAMATRIAVVLESTPQGVTLRPKQNIVPAELAASLVDQLDRYGMRRGSYAFSFSTDGRNTVLRIRPATLARAMPRLLASLQEHARLHVNMNDVLAVSRDPAILKASRGAAQVSAYARTAVGADLAELALAAMLGPYREDMPADLAASPSSLTGSRKSAEEEPGRRMQMIVGTVIHAALDWAALQYRNSGSLPTLAQTQARALEIWRREDTAAAAHLLEGPGETMSGYLEAMDKRLASMHASLAALLADYPIVIGTEVPNLAVLERSKDGPSARDILRGIYDLVVARQTSEGLEVRVVDYRTGQAPSIQSLYKDLQVLIYDLLARTLWRVLPLPYSAAGALKKVASIGVSLIYPNGTYSPVLDEEGRADFEKELRRLMDRLRDAKKSL